MSDSAKTTAMEEIFVPRASAGEDGNLYVCINGKSFLLPCGKRSTVPAYVAEEIRRSWAAAEAFEASTEKLEAKKV